MFLINVGHHGRVPLRFFSMVIGWREMRRATLRSRMMAISPASRPVSGLLLPDRTVIITDGIIADHTGVSE
jgi:hypothetical protein